MLSLELPKILPTSVNSTPAVSEKKLTAKWVKINSQLVCQWVSERA